MRPQQFFLYLFLISGFMPVATQAQFLKKLGKTVKQIAQETVASDTAANNASAPSPKTASATSKTASQMPAVDFEKHGIAVAHAGSASFNAGEGFLEEYSSVKIEDGKIIPIAPVLVLSESERLSEGDDVSGNDAVKIYEDGKPVKTTTLDALDKTAMKAENEKYDWYAIIENRDDTNNPYIKSAPNAMSFTITFNGKKYGPYMMALGMIVDKTKSRFYATVSVSQKDLEQRKMYLLSDDGKLRPLDLGGDLLANIDFSNACVVIPPATRYAYLMAKEDDEAKQQALQQQMTDAMMNHQNENDIAFLDGSKMSNMYTSSSWLGQTGNNIFSLKADSDEKRPAGLYLNGKVIAKDAHPQQGQAWCNGEGANWAYIDYKPDGDHLIFKDGTNITSAQHPRQIMLNGKSYMVWFMYNRAKSDEIILCSKAL